MIQADFLVQNSIIRTGSKKTGCLTGCMVFFAFVDGHFVKRKPQIQTQHTIDSIQQGVWLPKKKQGGTFD